MYALPRWEDAPETGASLLEVNLTIIHYSNQTIAYCQRKPLQKFGCG